MGDEVDKLAWLHVKDKRLLVARTRGKSTYYLPGGRREPGEGDEDALVREIREELSVDLERASISAAGTFRAQADGKPPGVLVRLSCYRATYAGTIAASSEIEEVRWIGYRDRAVCSPALQLVLDALHADGTIE
ncbi:MAG: NUDIX domain-containing protein [Polyangiaceae bacterium]|nr:NUDIX domain-containing protein [Polyangiaceae bacterium]